MQKNLLYFLLVFTPIVHGTVETWSVTVLHCVSIVMAVLCAVSAVQKENIKLNRSPLDIPIFLFLSLSCLSVIISVYPYASRIQLYKIINYIFIFYFVLNLVRSRQELFRLSWVIIVFGSIFATGGLLFLGGDILGFKVFSDGNSAVSLTFVNYNHFAGYLEMVVWLSVGMAIASNGPRRILFIVLGIYIAAAVIFSMSRGGVMGLLSGLIFFSTMTVCCAGRRKSVWLLVIFALLVVLVTGFLGADPVLERLMTMRTPLDAASSRLITWQGVVEMIKETPWFGTGIGTFKYVYPRYMVSSSRIFVEHAHNDYLELIAELGIIGLSVVLLSVFYIFYYTLRRIINLRDKQLQMIGLGALSGCFSILVHAVTEFNFSIPSNAILFVISIVIAISSADSGSSANERVRCSIRLKAKWSKQAYAGVALAGILLCAAVLSPYIGDHYAREGRKHNRAGDHTLAAMALDKAIFSDPGNAEHFKAAGDLMVERAIASSDKKERERFRLKAMNYYDKATTLCSINGSYYTKKAFNLMATGRMAEAEEAFLNAVNYAPMNAFARYDLGNFYFDQGRMGNALAEYRELISLDKKYMSIILNKLWRETKDYDRLRDAIPETSFERMMFANFMHGKGDLQAAIDELASAYAIEPTISNAEVHLSWLIRIERYYIAQEAGEKYIQKFGPQSSLLEKMASIYYKLGKKDELVSIYQKLLKNDPDSVSLYVSFANYYLKELQSSSDAVNIINMGLEVNPDAIRLHLFLGLIYREAGRHNESLSILQSLVEKNPNNARGHYELALSYHAMGEYMEAISAFERAVFLDPGELNYRHKLALLYKRLGLFNEAVEQLEGCLEVRPDYYRCKFALEKIRKEFDDSGSVKD